MPHIGHFRRPVDSFQSGGLSLIRPERDSLSMSQAPTVLDPWRLVWGEPFIDSQTLATAIEQDLKREAHPDFRTRLLVRDAAVAIRSYWGSRRFKQWLAIQPCRAADPRNLGGRSGRNGIPRDPETTGGQHRLDPTQPDLRPARPCDSRPSRGPHRRIDSHPDQGA